MTDQPIFPAAVLGALILTVCAGPAWTESNTDVACTGGTANAGGRVNCAEDVPDFIAEHADEDPFGRSPRFSIRVGTSGARGSEKWYQGGLWHETAWSNFGYAVLRAYAPSYRMWGSNADDRVDLQAYHDRVLDIYARNAHLPGSYATKWKSRGPAVKEASYRKPWDGITIWTGSGDDTVRGTTGNDTIRAAVDGRGEYGCWASTAQKACEALGEAGSKHYRGLGGDDLLVGGSGRDRLYGGEGDDRLYGGNGWDLLRGGPGNDHLDGGPGRDRLYGGEGDDRLYGGDGRDRLHGDPGNDYLDGGPDGDVLYGNAGDDWLVGGAGHDRLEGGPGSDFMQGGAGRDVYDLGGNAGADRDVILADRADGLRGQSFWREARRIGIGEVTMPGIRVGETTYTLDAVSLEGFAHRVDGADIVYRASD